MSDIKVTSKPTGTACTMFIEDDGSFIRFYIRSTDPNFSKNNIQNTYSFPNGKGTFRFNLAAGGAYTQVGSKLYAQKSGKVSWTLKKTGDAKIGGPTTITYEINRSGDPLPPKIVAVTPKASATNVRDIVINYQWRGGGGENAKQYQLGWSRSRSEKPTTVRNVTMSGSYTWSGFGNELAYYIYARMQNTAGKWSAWSEPYPIIVTGGVRVFWDGEWRWAMPYVKHNGAWKRASAYVKTGGVWKISG